MLVEDNSIDAKHELPKNCAGFATSGDLAVARILYVSRILLSSTRLDSTLLLSS